MGTILRHAQRFCAIAIFSVFWTGCGFTHEDPKWLVCDGVPLVVAGGWIQGIYRTQDPDGTRVLVPLERYTICREIRESQMHPAIFLQLRKDRP